MNNVWKNMGHNIFGKYLLMFFNIYLSLQWLMDRSFVYMEVCRLIYKELIKLKISIEFKMFHMMDLFVISYGPIQPKIINSLLCRLLEELDIAGDKRQLKSLTLEIILKRGFEKLYLLNVWYGINTTKIMIAPITIESCCCKPKM